MTYRAPVEEYLLPLRRSRPAWTRLRPATASPRPTPRLAAPILTEAGRLSPRRVLAPLRRAGDLDPARLENGVVRTTPGFAEGLPPDRRGRLGRADSRRRDHGGHAACRSR